LTRPYFESGDPGPLVAAWAQVPELLGVTLPSVGSILGPSSIGVRPKELCILRTSAVLECRYCVDAHTEVALDVGLDPAEVRALRNETPIESAFSDPAELALLAWIDAVALGPGQPGDDLAAAMTQHWRDFEIMELTLLIGATLMLNRFATSLALPTSVATVTNLATLGFPSTQATAS
jgi:AhpD family alkylhydroperoxidase